MGASKGRAPWQLRSKGSELRNIYYSIFKTLTIHPKVGGDGG